MTVSPISRRGSLGLMAASTGMLLAPSATARITSPGKNDLLTYLRIRGRLDGKPVYYPYRGTIFGKVFGQAAVAVFDVEGFSLSRITPLGDGRYRLDTAEAGYFLDRLTGMPLTTWVNPMNGVETTVKHYRSFSQIAISDGKIERILGASPSAQMEVSASMADQTRLSGKVWVHEDIIAKFPNKPQASFVDPREYVGPTLEATSLATWSADAADLADRGRAFVPAMLSYQTLGSWRPFMRMGSTPGLISWRMFGTKEASIDAVPTALRARVLAEYPDFLTRIS